MPVAQSTHVNDYAYNAQAKVLVVTFVNGASYRYDGVSQADYDTFHQAGSKGSYLHAKIIPAYGKGTLLSSPSRRRR